MIKYPFTDFHEMNLDWILQTVKECEEDTTDAVQTAESAASQAAAAATQASRAMQKADAAIETANGASADAAEALTIAQAYANIHRVELPTVGFSYLRKTTEEYYGIIITQGKNDNKFTIWTLRDTGDPAVSMMIPDTLAAGILTVEVDGTRGFKFSSASTPAYGVVIDVFGSSEVYEP